jgi:predicted  nucleic acid-binding Zn-ribbon protein
VNKSPASIRATLYQRGLGDLGEYIERQLNHITYLNRRMFALEELIAELQALLPDDVREARQAEQDALSEAARNSGGGSHRAPAESDG